MDQLLSALSADFLHTPLWMWIAFISLVLFLLVLDLGLFNRIDREISIRDSLRMSLFYISVGTAFGGWIWVELGETKAVEYFTGFLIEKTLSMDNIFVVAMIFSYFRIPRQYQHRVLFWGILGVILLRGLMIGLGAALVSEFDWVLYCFAAFLLYTAIKMLTANDEVFEVQEDNAVLRFLQRHFRLTSQLHGRKFWLRIAQGDHKKRPLHFTPLFVALVMVEIADIIFAVDSVPAIFTITTDTYIVYTSNIFAILGLRALYFLLSAMLSRFMYLQYALAVVLFFIGAKIFLTDMFELVHIPATLSLLITVGILGIGITASLWKTRSSRATE